MNKKQIFVNASGLKTSSCIRRAHWHLTVRYRNKHSSVEAEFGKAVHTYIHTYRQTGGNSNASLKAARDSFNAAVYPKKPKKAWMNTDRLEAACIFWQTHWLAANDDLVTLVGPDQKPITELKFALPYWANDNTEVILDGVIDDIARKGEKGSYCIRDYKTTQAWDIPTKLAEYRLDPQMLFYYVVVEQYAKQYPTSIFAQIYNTGFGTLVEGIFLKEYGEIKIQRSDMFFYDTETIEGFKRSLHTFIMRLVVEAENPAVPDPEGMLNGTCKFCDFRQVCGAVDSIAGEYVLQNNFVLKPSQTLTQETTTT